MAYIDTDIAIEVGQVIQLAREHLAGEWLKSSGDTVSIKVVSGGYCSRLYLCEDLTGKCEPSKFLIRINGGKILDENDSSKHYNEGTESIVFFMHGHLGYGPKLYGVFKGGRLEEYIQSRMLNDKDLEDPNIRIQIARKLARFHSMKLPVSKKPHPPLELLSSEYQLFNNAEGHKIFLEKSKLCGVDPAWVKQLDIPAEIDWVKRTLQKVGGRLVLSTNDMNKNNVLVRDVPDKFGEIVTIIDYELGGTNWRGVDIATHFVTWMADASKPDFLSGVPYPGAEIRREFVEEYLNQTKSMGVYDDFDADGLDSCDHVMMETDLMTFVTILKWVCFDLKPKLDTNVIFQDIKQHIKLNTLVRKMVEVYMDNKRIFNEKYSEELESDVVVRGKDLDILNSFHHC